MRSVGKIVFTFFMLLSVVLLSFQDKSYNIYVSPDGSDQGKGTVSDPVASLDYAAELARGKAGKVSVNIYLSGGYYRLKEALNLGIADGGTRDAPVTWQAVPGEKPIISGGLSVTNWKVEENGLWSVSLPLDFKGSFRSFYVNDKRAIRARFPDDTYLKINKSGKDKRTNFFFNKGDFPKVEQIDQLELVFLHDWSISRIGVKSIDWKKSHLITIDSIGSRLPFFTITNWEKQPRYYLENSKEFCDRPGEWYCDFVERKVYYYPLADEKINKTEGFIPIATKLLTIKGNRKDHVGFIRFKGISFKHTNWNIPDHGYCGVQACMFDDRSNNKIGWSKVPATIELDLAKNCEFYQCTISHTGGSGIWFRENCINCEISESHIFDISGNGINIGEGRDRLVNGEPWWISAPGQVAKNNRVLYTLIEDCGKQFYGAVGIWGGLISNTLIDHNEIRDLPYTGISIGWMWNPIPTPCRENVINANHIHHIMKRLSDGGGIYCLGLQPNSRISNNLIHDVTVNAGRAESNGMFLDEGIKDIIVENNIVYNIARSPLRFHKAFYNVVRNNIFVCGEDIPAIRYNSTKEEDIKKIDNTVLSQSSASDMEKLISIIKEREKGIGLNKDN